MFASDGLRWTCHQTRREILEAVEREATNPQHAYKIDVIIEDHHITPTWLVLPASITYMRNLSVNIRGFSSITHVGSDRDALPVPAHNNLMFLLSKLLVSGSAFAVRPRQIPSLNVDLLEVTIELFYETEGSFTQYSLFTQPTFWRPNRFGLKWILERLAASDLISGIVRNVRLNNGEEVFEWDVRDRNLMRETADVWAPYGWIPRR